MNFGGNIISEIISPSHEEESDSAFAQRSDFGPLGVQGSDSAEHNKGCSLDADGDDYINLYSCNRHLSTLLTSECVDTVG